jgi:divalent metal cation (Fe/Co/Zn/Cd) transporter
LIGESLEPQALEAIRKLVADDPAVEDVSHLHSMYLGADEVLLTIELRFDSKISALDVRKAVRRIRDAIRSQHPDVTRIFFGAESLSEDGDISVRH